MSPSSLDYFSLLGKFQFLYDIVNNQFVSQDRFRKTTSDTFKRL